MADFVCDNADIKKVLGKLGEILIREGAYLHPDLQVVCRDNNFSVHGARPVENGSRVIFIPHACRVHPDKFSLSLRGKNIFIESAAADVPALEQELMGMVIELYNLTDKLEQYKRSSVFSLYYEAPDLYKDLTKGLVFRAAKYFEQMPSGLAYLYGFLDLRIIGEDRAITPVIEYFNHDKNAQVVVIKDSEPDKGMTAQAYMPPGGDEFCISYGMASNARALFVYEGFLDHSINVVPSLPLEFGIENINIAVYQDLARPALKELPADMADLHGYCPYFNLKVENTIQFGFLYIPGKSAPRSLRRILFYGIHMLVKDKDRATRLAYTAERIIISENLEYYKDLKKRIDRLTPSPGTKEFIKSAREMIEFQLSMIESYPFFEEAMNYNLRTASG